MGTTGTCIDDAFVIDALNNPAVTFEYSADMDFSVRLIPSSYNNLPNTQNESVLIGSATAGDGVFSVDVNAETGLSSYLVNGKLEVKGIRFDFADQGTLSISSFRLQKEADRINTTYYLDSINGNDSNDGLSPESAWKTLEKANSVTFQPGTRLLLKAGSIFSGSLQPNATDAPEKCLLSTDTGKETSRLSMGTGLLMRSIWTTFEYVEVRNLEITNLSPEKDLRRAVSVISGGTTAAG